MRVRGALNAEQPGKIKTFIFTRYLFSKRMSVQQTWKDKFWKCFLIVRQRGTFWNDPQNSGRADQVGNRVTLTNCLLTLITRPFFILKWQGGRGRGRSVGLLLNFDKLSFNWNLALLLHSSHSFGKCWAILHISDISSNQISKQGFQVFKMFPSLNMKHNMHHELGWRTCSSRQETKLTSLGRGWVKTPPT